MCRTGALACPPGMVSSPETRRQAGARQAGAPVVHLSLRPLALPTEHGGWGFLFEPLVLAMIAAPSWCGVLLCAAAIGAFLTRQPLKLAMQDLLKRRLYPRTKWCAMFAISYGAAAFVALAVALAFGGWRIAIPYAVAAPLAIVNIVYDARNRSRALLPELTGPVAMASSAAAIGIAGGLPLRAAFILMTLVVLRGLPAVVYVRTLLLRAHGKTASNIPAIAMHAASMLIAAVLGRFVAVFMLTALLGRALYGLTHTVAPAKSIGWREMGWGAVYAVVCGAA